MLAQVYVWLYAYSIIPLVEPSINLFISHLNITITIYKTLFYQDHAAQESRFPNESRKIVQNNWHSFTLKEGAASSEHLTSHFEARLRIKTGA